MSINTGFAIEVERETANTRRIISKLEDKHLGWRLHEKSMTTSELVGHVVELHNWVNNALVIEDFDLATNYVPFKPTSVQEALDALNQGFDKNIEIINSFSDEEWQKMWKLRFGDYVVSEIPKIGALRHIIYNHLIHHRGQLSVYLRLMDVPVPGIYGPSSDDRMNA